MGIAGKQYFIDNKYTAGTGVDQAARRRGGTTPYPTAYYEEVQ